MVVALKKEKMWWAMPVGELTLFQALKRLKLKKRQLFIFGLGLLTLFSYIKAVTQLAQLATLDSYLIIYNSNGITYELAFQAGEQNDRQKKSYSFTLWGEEAGVTIENRNLYRVVNDVSKLSVYGSTSLLFNNAPILEKEDQTGCLIDGETAMKLFGMTDVVGHVVRYLDKEYIIRGVIPEVSPVFVTQINSNEKSNDNVLEAAKKSVRALDTVIVRIDDRLPSQIMTELDLMGINGKKVPFQTIKALLYLYLLILPSSLTLMLLCLLRRYAKNAVNLSSNLSVESEIKIGMLGFKYSPMYWFWTFLFIVVLFSFFWQLTQHTMLPKDVAPPKWSDFTFWNNLLVEKKEELAFFLKIPKRTSEMLYVWSMIKVVVYSTLSLFGYLLTLLGLGIIVKNKRDL